MEAMNKPTAEQRKIVEDLDWNIIENDDGTITLETWSELGEDLIEDLPKDKTFADGAKSIYVNYDWEEHVEPLINMRGQRGVPDSIKDLVADAMDIERKYKELFDKINENEREQK